MTPPPQLRLLARDDARDAPQRTMRDRRSSRVRAGTRARATSPSGGAAPELTGWPLVRRGRSSVSAPRSVDFSGHSPSPSGSGATTITPGGRSDELGSSSGSANAAHTQPPRRSASGAVTPGSPTSSTLLGRVHARLGGEIAPHIVSWTRTRREDRAVPMCSHRGEPQARHLADDVARPWSATRTSTVSCGDRGERVLCTMTRAGGSPAKATFSIDRDIQSTVGVAGRHDRRADRQRAVDDVRPAGRQRRGWRHDGQDGQLLLPSRRSSSRSHGKA